MSGAEIILGVLVVAFIWVTVILLRDAVIAMRRYRTKAFRQLEYQISQRKKKGVFRGPPPQTARVCDGAEASRKYEEWLAELLRDAQNDGRISAKEARELHIKWSNENDAVVARIKALHQNGERRERLGRFADFFYPEGDR